MRPGTTKYLMPAVLKAAKYPTNSSCPVGPREAEAQTGLCEALANLYR